MTQISLDTPRLTSSLTLTLSLSSFFLFLLKIKFDGVEGHLSLKMRKLLSFRRLSMHSPWKENFTVSQVYLTNLSWFLFYYLCNGNKNVSSSNIWNFIWFKWLEKSHHVIEVNLFVIIIIKSIIITWYLSNLLHQQIF